MFDTRLTRSATRCALAASGETPRLSGHARTTTTLMTYSISYVITQFVRYLSRNGISGRTLGVMPLGRKNGHIKRQHIPTGVPIFFAGVRAEGGRERRRGESGQPVSVNGTSRQSMCSCGMGLLRVGVFCGEQRVPARHCSHHSSYFVKRENMRTYVVRLRNTQNVSLP